MSVHKICSLRNISKLTVFCCTNAIFGVQLQLFLVGFDHVIKQTCVKEISYYVLKIVNNHTEVLKLHIRLYLYIFIN